MTFENVPTVFAYRCHLCGKLKASADPVRALYLLAFHYDRRHRGWTHPGEISTSVSAGGETTPQ